MPMFLGHLIVFIAVYTHYYHKQGKLKKLVIIYVMLLQHNRCLGLKITAMPYIINEKICFMPCIEKNKGTSVCASVHLDCILKALFFLILGLRCFFLQNIKVGGGKKK